MEDGSPLFVDQGFKESEFQVLNVKEVTMLSNNYIAKLIVKDHSKRLLEEARKARLPEGVEKSNPKVKKHRHFSKMSKSMKFFGLRLQNKKL